MKRTMTLASLFLAPMLSAAEPAKPAARPNVLFIISDDQGFSDFGFTGNPVLKTPQLDRLSQQSAIFTNFTVAPACSPSRSAFFTGRDHLLTGVWGVGERNNLRSDETLMPAFFKAAGYRTFHAGKGDCVRTNDTDPWDRGWDDAYLVGGYQHQDPTLFHRGGPEHPKGWTAEHPKGWTADIMTDLLLKFIQEKNTQSPAWFATAAYIIPHLPFLCDKKYSAPYLAQGLSSQLAECYGSIAQMDFNIGRLLDGLKQSGQESNTIVVFVSDNGMSNKYTLSNEWSEQDWAIRNFHKLRGSKATVWQNGVCVPMLVRWPEKIAPGVRPQLGLGEDILPTLLDLSGLPENIAAHLAFSGVSLSPAIRNAATTFERPAAFRMAIAGPGSPRNVPDVAQRKYEDHHLELRDGRFKYHSLPGGQCALYDILVDPCETQDLQAKFPEVIHRMDAECRQRWQAILTSGRSFMPPPEKTAAKARQAAHSNPE